MRPPCSTTNRRAVSPGVDVRYTGLVNVPNDCSAGPGGGGGGGGGGFTVPVQAAITAMTNRNRSIDAIHRERRLCCNRHDRRWRERVGIEPTEPFSGPK